METPGPIIEPWMSPSERLTRYRATQKAVEKKRPQYRDASPEEQAAFAKVSPAERMTAYREQCRVEKPS